ncbi:MAG TPA: DUF2092 domain-containing protein [Tepidisphaeraceae bacterium]
MKRFASRTVFLLFGILACGLLSVHADETPSGSGIDPKCEAVVRQMGARLVAAKAFTFNAYTVRQQFLEDGQKVDIARRERVAVRRPDRVAASIASDDGDTEFTFDGHTVTLLNVDNHAYGQTEIKGDLDAMFDHLANDYGMTVPLVDLILADPAKALLSRARTCTDVGVGYVFDTKCRHLAFRQEGIDWEIWIQDGAEPLPRKLAIVYKDTPGHPEYVAYLSDWNLNADVPESRFTFTPPPGAKRVDFAVHVTPGSPVTLPSK